VLTTAAAAVTDAVSIAALIAEPVRLALRRDAPARSDSQLCGVRHGVHLLGLVRDVSGGVRLTRGAAS
jgi:hypothetical protein